MKKRDISLCRLMALTFVFRSSLFLRLSRCIYPSNRLFMRSTCFFSMLSSFSDPNDLIFAMLCNDTLVYLVGLENLWSISVAKIKPSVSIGLFVSVISLLMLAMDSS
jgi:hypothetical protein